MTRLILPIIFLTFCCNGLKAQEKDSLLYSDMSFSELLDIVKYAEMSFDLPDGSFKQTEDPKVLISKNWTSKISYRITPIGFMDMIPTFQQKYVISSSRELLGQERVTLHGRKGFVTKFKELQEDGEHYILWVVIFGDDRITFSASASYPESKDPELEDHYFKMMKEVKIKL